MPIHAINKKKNTIDNIKWLDQESTDSPSIDKTDAGLRVGQLSPLIPKLRYISLRFTPSLYELFILFTQ